MASGEIAEVPGVFGNASDDAQPAVAGAPIFCSTGYASLDAALPGGGWPCGATSELLLSVHGIGELRLLLPLFEAVNRRGQWMAWVAPPFAPYAPALAEYGVAIDRLLVVSPEPAEIAVGASDLWAAEAVLESKAVPLVLLWHADANVPLRSLRRLQLAAMRSGAALLLLRPANVVAQPSPAVLRMSLEAFPDNILQVTVFKARGLAGRREVRLALPECVRYYEEGNQSHD